MCVVWLSCALAVEDVQTLLIAWLHTPMPAGVDSMCVAGLLELLRTAGMWHASTRYGYVFGALGERLNLCLARWYHVHTATLWGVSLIRWCVP